MSGISRTKKRAEQDAPVCYCGDCKHCQQDGRFKSCIDGRNLIGTCELTGESMLIWVKKDCINFNNQ